MESIVGVVECTMNGAVDISKNCIDPRGSQISSVNFFQGVQVKDHGIKHDWNFKQILQVIRRISNVTWRNRGDKMFTAWIADILHAHFALVFFQVSNQKGKPLGIHVEPNDHCQ